MEQNNNKLVVIELVCIADVRKIASVLPALVRLGGKLLLIHLLDQVSIDLYRRLDAH